MCGICGIYNFENKKISIENLKILNDAMIERGPDDHGYFIENNFGFAMRRLSIIDLENGQQPMFSENNSIAIIFNGEIYNFKELRKKLKNEGYKFKTNSDTEVILKIYEKKGINFVQDLNGMFSICIYDKKKNLVLLFRDRIGIKPVYYFKNESTFIFSSSLKSFKKFLKKVNISEENYYLYNLFNHFPGDKTVYENINKLSPGKYIKIENNNFEIQDYWQLRFSDEYDYEYSSNKILEYLNESVEINLRSDVPIATLLSSGMDSSILSFLVKDKKINQLTLSADYENKIFNESDEARKFSKYINSDHQSFKIDRENFFKNLNELSKVIDEPNSDSSIVTTFILSKFARAKNIKVLLSGAGADELFGGYTRYVDNIKNKLFGSLKLVKKIKFLSKYLPLKYKNYLNKLSDKKLALVLNNSGQNFELVLKSIKNKNIELFFEKYINDLFYNLNNNSFELNSKKIMYNDFINYLNNNILSGFDKATMSASIEGRVPYLDHRIAEIIFKTKFDKFYFKRRKKFLIENFESKLPSYIFEKRKIGFNAPLDNWHSEISDNFFYKISLNKYLSDNLDLEYLKKNKKNKIFNQLFYSNYFFNEWLSN